MRHSFVKNAVLVLTAVTLLAAGGSFARAATYNGGDLLVVIYQPHGREFIADLGPASAFTGSAVPVSVSQYTESDLSGVYGGTLPASLQIAVIGANGVDGYIATGGPATTAVVGSAIGASNQIRFLGGNFANLSAPVATNPAAGTFEAGDVRSYQNTLNGRVPGSLGNNVPFSVEGTLAGASVDLPLFSGRFNPFAGVPATQSLLGTFRFGPDGTAVYLPARSIQATCVAGPHTINPKANGAGFSFSVVLTDVTDPLNPIAVPLQRMSPAWISQVGDTTLPTPFSGPGCTSDQDGIWETTGLRVDPFINFSAASDGDCATLDGNRQDILAVVGRSSGATPICIGATVDGNPVACCDTVNVLAKSSR
jgi:hypothetical protein